MRDKRVRMPYSENNLPCDAVIYGDIGATLAAVAAAEKSGDEHKVGRAGSRVVSQFEIVEP